MLEVHSQVWFAVFYFGLIGLAIYILDTWHKLTKTDADET